MVQVVLDGQPRELRLTVRALRRLELLAEKHLGWFLVELSQGRCGFAVAVWLLWAGLQHEAQAPSVDDVDALVERFLKGGGKLHEFREPFARLISEMFSPPKTDQGNAPTGAGTPSPTSASTNG